MKRYIFGNSSDTVESVANMNMYGRINVASNPTTPKDVLEMLAYDPDMMTRYRVAYNPRTTDSTVLSMIHDDEPFVAEAAICNSNLSDREKYEEFLRLYNYGCDVGWDVVDPDGDVYGDIIYDICCSPCITDQVISRLEHEAYWDYISIGLSLNPKVSADVLRSVLNAVEKHHVRQSDEWDILHNLAKNPSTPNDVLHGVIKYALECILTPDDSECIIQNARHNPNYSEGDT